MTVAAHPAHVSRLLAKAGHDRSEWESTSVYGHRRTYPGFRVLRAASGQVLVYHEVTNDSPDADRITPRTVQRAQALDAYAATLTGAGYAVTRGTGDYREDCLWVTRPAERGLTP